MTVGQPHLEDNERMLVACLRILARRLAIETQRMPENEALRTATGEVLAAASQLGGVSPTFAMETARYLGRELRRLRTS